MDSGIMLIAQIAAAAAAAYLGAYWAKRGQNKAIHQDLDKLLDQTNAVTQATKSIEAAISNDVWDRQKRWEIKRDVLFELIREFGSIEYNLAIMQMTFRAANRPIGPEALKQRETVADGWNAALLAFKRAKGLALLVCGDDVRTALDSLQKSITKTANEATSGQMSSPDWYKELGAETEAVTKLVKNELNLN